LRFLDHTQLDVHIRYNSSGQAISSSQRPLPTQHTRDERPCLQRYSNPRLHLRPHDHRHRHIYS